MAVRVIHFGPDECHRLMLLRSAGYSVEDCRSLVELHACLASDAMADALFLSDAEGIQPQEAILLARSQSSLPVVLFRNTNLAYQESGVDLVVHCLTPPEVWLKEVDALIEKSRAIRVLSWQERARPSAVGFAPASDRPTSGKQSFPKTGSE